MEFSFDFKITEENKKAIEKILKQKGLKYYVLEDKKTKEKLDLVEYKDYKELEEELDKYKSLYENEKEEHKKEIKEYQEELEKADSITQSCIFMGSKESGISYRKCLNELETYKKLYQNEKNHTDTLKRIIKNIEEYIEELYDNTDDTTCYDIEKNCKREILDLLKEIK